MKKGIKFLVALLFVPAGLFAGDYDFTDNEFIKQISAAPVSFSAEVKAVPVMPERVKKSSAVQISGLLTLRGSGNMMLASGGFVMVNLSGTGLFKDPTGKISSGSIPVNVAVSVWAAPGQPIMQTITPNIHIPLYKDGRQIGVANVSGVINATGFAAGKTVSLSGAGYFSGTAVIEE